MKLRSFIAVRVPPTPALRHTLRQLNEMGRTLRAVSPDNLHLTLRFLGDTDPSLFDEIAGAMTAAVVDVQPFAIHWQGMGVFPDARRPSVLWVGAAAQTPLPQIVGRLNPQLDALGFTPERRPWQAHLTVARIKAKPPTSFWPFLEQHATTDFGSVPVDSIELLTSDLRPTGPVYSVTRTVPLAVAGGSK